MVPSKSYISFQKDSPPPKSKDKSLGNILYPNSMGSKFRVRGSIADLETISSNIFFLNNSFSSVLAV